MQNYIETVIAKFGNSNVLLSVIESFNGAVDPSVDLNNFYGNIWDLDTAIGTGLDIWGRIVGVNRVITIQNNNVFGFNTGVYRDFQPFGQAPFNNSQRSTLNYALSDTAFRQLIYVKAAANITGSSVPALNNLLRQLFAGRGRCYVNNLADFGYPMSMRYTFEFYLLPYEFSILASTGVIPHPTGVSVYLLEEPQGSTFGFGEAGPTSSAPFGQGSFLANGATHVG